MKKFKKFINKSTPITDTTSTKSTVEKLFKNYNFIGSHPMAGSEKSGYAYSSEKILENRTCIICNNNQKKTMNFIEQFWLSLKMNTVKVSSDEHDFSTGVSSHFIHLLSFTYIDYIKTKKIKIKNFIGPSFKEFTRIAGSNPEIWKDIFIDNKNKLNIITDSFINSLKKFQKSLNNDKKLYKKIKEIREFIIKLPKKKNEK